MLLSSKASIADFLSRSLNIENYSLRMEGILVIIFACDKNKVKICGLIGTWSHRWLMAAQSLFCCTMLPFLDILLHVCWICGVPDIVSNHVGRLCLDHGMPWLKKKSQPPFHKHLWSTFLGARFWACSVGTNQRWPSSPGAWGLVIHSRPTRNDFAFPLYKHK